MKKQIKWCSSEEDDILISTIVDRILIKDPSFDKVDLMMDIAATHCNGTKLDLEKLLNFDDFNFYHDVFGIMKHINRTTGKLDNCFLPRCSK